MNKIVKLYDNFIIYIKKIDFDKLLHSYINTCLLIIIFGVFNLFFNLTLSIIISTFILLFFDIIIKEIIIDKLIRKTKVDLIDINANIIGILIGYILIYILLK